MMLISVEDAQAIILQNIPARMPQEYVPLMEASGRILSREVQSDIHIPPFTNTSMDGYALKAFDVKDASPTHPVSLKVVGTIRAGHSPTDTLQAGECFKIMTGAPVPECADAVAPIEWTRQLSNDEVAILRAVEPGAHLRFKGEDMVQGHPVLSGGTLITPPTVGILATVGMHQVPVIQRPRVAILSTGDELREPNEALAPGTIRNSNSYAIAAAIQQAGGEPRYYPTVPDESDAVRTLFRRAAQECDLLVSSGGVSVGDFDFVKPVIEELGALTLWRVNLKPGKPLAFGHVLGVPIIGLPGNPVSALVTFELFVRPAIRALLGDSHGKRPEVRLPLFTDFRDVEERRHYVRCRLMVDHGHLVLWPHQNQGSAIQTSWQNVDALMIVPENTGPYAKGEELQALLLSLNHIATEAILPHSP